MSLARASSVAANRSFSTAPSLTSGLWKATVHRRGASVNVAAHRNDYMEVRQLPGLARVPEDTPGIGSLVSGRRVMGTIDRDTDGFVFKPLLQQGARSPDDAFVEWTFTPDIR